MKYSTLSHLLCYLTGIFLTLTIYNLLSNNSMAITSIFISINIYSLTLLSVMNDRIKHLIKLNQVQKQQLLNRRVHDEIHKLNFKFNQQYKKNN